MSGRIDDPVDASFEGWPDEPSDLGQTFGELALSFGALIFPPAKVLSILKDRFLPSSRVARVIYLLDGLRIKLDHLESSTRDQFRGVASQGTELREALKSVQSKVETPQFEEAVAEACEEATRALNLRKIDQLSAVLVGTLLPTDWGSHDVAKMIRDLAQLGELDLMCLELLAEVNGQYVNTDPVSNNVNVFIDRMSEQFAAMLASKINPDDYLGCCARLIGFGLALEESRMKGDLRLAARCFRPTRRGMVLLEALKRGR